MVTLREFILDQSTLPTGNIVRDHIQNPGEGGGGDTTIFVGGISTAHINTVLSSNIETVLSLNINSPILTAEIHEVISVNISGGQHTVEI